MKQIPAKTAATNNGKYESGLFLNFNVKNPEPTMQRIARIENTMINGSSSILNPKLLELEMLKNIEIKIRTNAPRLIK